MRSYLVIVLSLVILSCSKSNTTVTPVTTTNSSFKLTSTAVVNDLLLDAFKCEAKVNGVENSMPFAWTGAPAATVAYAMTMISYPNPSDLTVFSSYLELWGIDKSVSSIAYGKADDGPWFMGPNKDLKNISYSSPCSAGSGTHQYIVTIYALSATPSSLPTQSSMTVTNQVLTSALSTVTILDKTTLTFNSVTP